jgi:hypothetical protein
MNKRIASLSIILASTIVLSACGLLFPEEDMRKTLTSAKWRFLYKIDNYDKIPRTNGGSTVERLFLPDGNGKSVTKNNSSGLPPILKEGESDFQWAIIPSTRNTRLGKWTLQVTFPPLTLRDSTGNIIRTTQPFQENNAINKLTSDTLIVGGDGRHGAVLDYYIAIR